MTRTREENTRDLEWEENHCVTCGAELEDDEESMHYNCGGECLWCMAKSGDAESRARIEHFFFEDCMEQLTETVNEFVTHVQELGGDESLFRTMILETWRPW